MKFTQDMFQFRKLNETTCYNNLNMRLVYNALHTERVDVVTKAHTILITFHTTHMKLKRM